MAIGSSVTRRILVTGASGFVGRHLLPALRRHWPAVHIVAASHAPAAGADERVEMELTDAESIAAAVEAARPDIIFHLAAQSSVLGAAIDGALTWQTNFVGSLALAKAIAATAPQATLFFASSAEVYGATFNNGPVDEAAPLRPINAYARSKAAAEAMFGDVLPESVRLIVLRLSNHSGVGQTDSFVIPSFARQIAQVEAGVRTSVRVGRLDTRRDFLDVADVVRCYLMLLDAAPSLPSRNVFNIASGHPIMVGELLDRLRGMARVPVAIETDPERVRPSEVPVVQIDVSAIRALGWEGRVPLTDTLAAVLAEQRAAHRQLCA